MSSACPGRCTIRAPLASSLGCGVPRSTAAYLESLQRYASEHGRLVVLYSDRHCIFTKHDPEDPEPIECERTVGELNIESILARSQKAKELQSSCAA